MDIPSRRDFGKTLGLSAAGWLVAGQASTSWSQEKLTEKKETYETEAKGIRILPGQWRPHYPFEQIAWVSPTWPSQDYIWLDFPEAIFTNIGLIFLSHVNPSFPVVFPDLPKVFWQVLPNGIAFERKLPNGIKFGGSVLKKEDQVVALSLYIDNGSSQPLKEIKLQTCAYLRGIKEFADYTLDNKLVHVPERGWMKFDEARKTGVVPGRFHLGWRGGPKSADLPVMVTVSSQPDRLVAMTWYQHTLSMVGNPRHPCMHADPFFPDIEPGQRAEIYGELLFFDGTLAKFQAWFVERWRVNSE